MNTDTPDTTARPVPAPVFFMGDMNATARMARAMQELAALLPVEFPDPPAPTGMSGFVSGTGLSGIVSIHFVSHEVSVQVVAAVFVDAAMTGKVVGVETREVHHAGPNRPATMHYEAWLPNLLPESKLRVKVTACETLGA